MRQMPNLRYTARARPQKLQRVYFRVLNLGVLRHRIICDFFAMDTYFPDASSSRLRNGMPRPFSKA